MAKSQSPKDYEDSVMKDNIRNKVEKMFSDQDLPTYASVREVEAMKARIHELETELARQSESQRTNSIATDDELITTQHSESRNYFSNWSSPKDTQPDSRNRIQNATRTLSLLIGAMGFSLPIYFYWAVKTGAWQIYAIIAALIFSGVVMGFAISLVRRNRIEKGMELLIANACFIIPLMVSLI
ncbi:MAG TPA: hypothetical protein VJM08_00255, partial [Anaerolineales bacterium]|nr:hypothetical protein [Anaerolineales bacterium]